MNAYLKTSVLLTLTLTLFAGAVAHGQEFWEKKPYQKWTEEEARKILNKSPWAQDKVFAQTIIQPLQSPGSGRLSPTPTDPNARSPEPMAREDVGRARESRPTLTYQAQFRSALPIRQAIARLGQITAKYDQMTAEQRQIFDKDVDTFLAKRFPDHIVLYVAYSSNVAVDDRELAFHWQSLTTDTLKNFVFLIRSGGEKVPLAAYSVSKGAGREFQFVFPRVVDGRPVLRPGDKTLQLEFTHPKIRDQKEARVLISFNAEKMFMNGEAVY